MDNDQDTSNTADNSLENTDTVIQQPMTAAVPNDKTNEQLPQTFPIANPETLEPEQSQSVKTTDQTNSPPEKRPIDAPKRSIAQRVQHLVSRFNIYVLIFILILIIGGIATYVSFKSNNKTSNNTTISGQSLSAEDLQNLKNNNSTVGDATQTLTIASNSIFNGQVLMKGSLNVAGTINVGGALSLPGITVSGTSAFNNIQVGNNLSIAGNTAIQGMLTIQKNIQVNGSASFGGTISAPAIDIDQLILNKDLVLNRHIDPGGPTPRVSSGTAIGSGGTVSINGTDTAGTVNVNFGAGTYAGILANIDFSSNFNSTPHIEITPVGSNCAGMGYYVNRDTSSFSIGTVTTGPAGHSCSFDYMVMD